MPTKATKKTPAVRHSPMEHPRHQDPAETAALQQIAQGCGLVEKIKWGKPCYMDGEKNIVLIQRFKEYVALMFFKGSLMKDPKKLLHQIGEMEVPRQLRFTSVGEIEDQASTIRAYIMEALELEKSGAKVERKKVAEIEVPAELQQRLDSDAALKKAFAGLTPGRQKGYLYQIAAAKQAATRASRVEKYAPQILAGKGLMD
jgi:uncharacterized protein YdeI (YjbR/CyaY-like superfamily)